MTPYLFGPAFSTLVRSVRLYALERGLDLPCGLAPAGRMIAWRSEAHLALHPFGQVPVLLDGEHRIFETLAICRHLDRQLRPTLEIRADPEQDTWVSALLTTVDTRLVRRYLLRVAGPRPDPFRTREEQEHASAQVSATLAVLDRQLGDKTFLCGSDVGLPDALLAPMLDYLECLPEPDWLADWPRLAAYLDQLRARPSGQAILVASDFALR
ncbi:glutathione S-transferase family protein [Pseudomonas oryzihabitans]|uniref:glutathione S-transferase family protein n=1 Tax=Pseudomonas oryzihabitans TaxID=47885 RepID=UPI002894F6EF|nr:glutathione S-transferase family protein [Pseudomonas oryzihabitans]MDT3723062.1 glutathione S-transferase family protein [Pseudomonas oryzihabitans]